MTDERKPYSAALPRQATDRIREFVDADGVRWRAYEIPFSEYDRRRGLSLIFASEVAVRRVRDYPSNWDMLSDEELSILSWKA